MNFNKEEFAEILQIMSNSYGSINKMAKKTGVTASYISKLIRLKYNNPPSPEILQKLSDNSISLTSYDNLMCICGYSNNTKQNINNNSINFNFIKYKNLNKTGQKKVNDYINDLIATNKYNKKIE